VKRVNPLIKNEPGKQELFLGNEAIARGVLEAGVQVAAAYPGTPSSEIVDSLAKVAKETGQHVEWSTNEKVAFECAAGAAFLGVRGFTAMKSVGLNVAMDPLMVVNIAGVEGGFVFVSADDPNCWSTQNEQDSRLLAFCAEIPCLEPASVQEAKDIIPYAYELSEKLGRVVMVRTVTRLNHARAHVELGPLSGEKREARYFGQRAGFYALPKHNQLHDNWDQFMEAAESCPFNELDLKPRADIGVIASGHASRYVHEVLEALNLSEEVSFLKIAAVNPLPKKLIKKILKQHQTVIVFEEIEPHIEDKVKSLCYDFSVHPRVIGKLSGHLEVAGELTMEKVRSVLAAAFDDHAAAAPEPPSEQLNDIVFKRDTVLCAGCSHMGAFYAIRRASKKQRVKVLVAGDVGCYGLGLSPPYNLFDSHICMGASIGIGNGYAAAGYNGAIVCVIGDSTLYHSGIPALVNAVYNQHNITVVVLDNSIIGMTGHQPDPCTGYTAMGDPADKLDIADMIRACGVKHLREVNPFKTDESINTIIESINYNGPSVVITRGECAIAAGRVRKVKRPPYVINKETCDDCGVCASVLYCPAINKTSEGFEINQSLCEGCGICVQVCRKNAILKKAS